MPCLPSYMGVTLETLLNRVIQSSAKRIFRQNGVFIYATKCWKDGKKDGGRTSETCRGIKAQEF